MATTNRQKLPTGRNPYVSEVSSALLDDSIVKQGLTCWSTSPQRLVDSELNIQVCFASA